MELSIIIVTYNSKRFVSLLLHSLLRAIKSISAEIIIVDNASNDGTVEFIRSRYAREINNNTIQIIENSENVGFSRANNIGIQKASGDKIAMINPDILVEEDTFSKILDKFKTHPHIAGVAPKIINPDGTFAVDSRHAIPDPEIAFWKAIGFQKLFPKSKVFGQYNLTFLDENVETDIPALSGSFMVFKKSVLTEIGYLDEDFFMYCEDIDLCKRIRDKKKIIRYFPDIRVLHFKGESTLIHNFTYIQTFNQSMILFYKKHFRKQLNLFWDLIIHLGIWGRGLLIFFKNNIRRWRHLGVSLPALIIPLVFLPTSGSLIPKWFLLYLLFYFIFSPGKPKALDSITMQIAFVTAGIGSYITERVAGNSGNLLGWYTITAWSIFAILSIIELKRRVKPDPSEGFIADLITPDRIFTVRQLELFFRKKVIIANLTDIKEWEKTHSTDQSTSIIFDIRLPMKFCFDVMEKYPGKQYLFWDPDNQFLLGDDIQTDLQGNDQNNRNKDLPNCQFWYFILKKIAPALERNSQVAAIKRKNEITKKVIQTYLKWFDETDRSKKYCNEKLSYFWLFLQFRKRIRAYFNK